MTSQPSLFSTIGCADMFQLATIAYAMIDLILDWDEFNDCSRPVHLWLMASYIFGTLFRAAQITSGHYAGEGKEFLLSLRHDRMIAKALLWLTWCCFLPLFVACTFLGTYWLYDVLNDTPSCLP